MMLLTTKRLLLTWAFCFTIVVSPLLFSTPLFAKTKTVLPSDTLGFLVINNVQKSAEKLTKLAQELQLSNAHVPLVFVQTILEHCEAADPEGDFVIAILPTSLERESLPQPFLFVPVTDYSKFITPLGGNTKTQVASITLMGESLEVTRWEHYAVIALSGNFPRLERFNSAGHRTITLEDDFEKWLDEQDVVFSVRPPGTAIFLKALQSSSPYPHPRRLQIRNGQKKEHHTDISQASVVALTLQIKTMFTWLPRSSHYPLMQMISRNPEYFEQLEKNFSSLALGIRWDEKSNTIFQTRCTWNKRSTYRNSVWPKETMVAAHTLGLAKNYVALIGGNFPQQFSEEQRKQLLKNFVASSITGYNMMPPESQKTVRKELFKTSLNWTSISYAWNLPEKEMPLYSAINTTFRVKNSEKSLSNKKEFLKIWNSVKKQARTPVTAELKTFEVANLPGLKIRIPMASLFGLYGSRNGKQMAETLFGEEGVLETSLVQINQHQVLESVGSDPQQLEKLIQAIQSKTSATLPASIQKTESLMMKRFQWFVLISPAGSENWNKQVRAMTRATFSGEKIKASPPLGVSFFGNQQKALVEVVIPIATMKEVLKIKIGRGVLF